MYNSTITSKGQITIPSSLRNELSLHQGDVIRFTKSNTHIVLTKVKSKIHESFGILKASKGVSLDDMQKAIKEGAAHDRS